LISLRFFRVDFRLPDANIDWLGKQTHRSSTMFDIFLYDENGEYLRTICYVDTYHKRVQELTAKGYSVKVVSCYDGTIVYTLDAQP
jgi:hypothetical protein